MDKAIGPQTPMDRDDDEEEIDEDEDDKHDNYYDGEEDEELQEVCCSRLSQALRTTNAWVKFALFSLSPILVKCCQIFDHSREKAKDEMRCDRNEDHP